MPQRRKKQATKRAAPRGGANRDTPAPGDDAPEHDESVDPANVEVSKPPDPDGRIPPDHQHDGRIEGRAPEQEIVEEAREGQAPPLNPDPGEDLVAEK